MVTSPDHRKNESSGLVIEALRSLQDCGLDRRKRRYRARYKQPGDVLSLLCRSKTWRGTLATTKASYRNQKRQHWAVGCDGASSDSTQSLGPDVPSLQKRRNGMLVQPCSFETCAVDWSRTRTRTRNLRRRCTWSSNVHQQRKRALQIKALTAVWKLQSHAGLRPVSRAPRIFAAVFGVVS